MKIESTGFTYQRINTNTNARPALPVKMQSQNAQAEIEQQGPSLSAEVSAQTKTIEDNRPLSAHLSNEEQEMLQTLFPSTGRAHGIQAYKRTHGIQEAKRSGLKVDLTT